MSLICLAISLVLSLSCVASSACQIQRREPQGYGQFIDAKLTSDGKVGIFTFNRSVKISSEYDRSPFIFSRAPREIPVGLVIGRTYIGTYDVETGLIKILWMTENKQWLRDGYKLYVHSLSGGTALIIERGQHRVTYDWAENEYYWLDIESGRLKTLPIRQELAQRGVKLKDFYLLDPDGTLLIETSQTNAPVYRDSNFLPDLWLRYPSGEYMLLDYASHFYENYSSNGEVYYSESTGFPAPPHKGLKVYDVKTRTSREVDYRNVTAREYLAETELSVNGFGKLMVSRKIKDTRPSKWEHKTLDINTDVLK